MYGSTLLYKLEQLHLDFKLNKMKPIEIEKRYCMNCGIEITGRLGKMFCSDSCRNRHNNKQNKDSTNLIRNVNNKLRKNHRILSELNFEDRIKVERKLLKKKGFDFEFFTSVLNSKTGKDYYFVYDQGFVELEEDIFMLMKKDF
jgi:predicted nucleic acid-binding Zn ribbon protein